MADLAPEGFRTPPHNVDAEQAVLGACMINNAAIEQAGRLRPEDFYEGLHGRVWAEMLRLSSSGSMADAVTLAHHFADDEVMKGNGGARKYLADLMMASTTVGNVRSYAREIVSLAQKRRGISLTEKATTAFYSGGDAGSWQEIISNLRQGIDEITDGVDEVQVRSFGDVLTSLAAKLENPVRPLSTGLPSLDKSMGGGMRPGIYLVEGKAKSSKSALLGTVMWHHMKLGTRCLSITLEMGPETVTQRLVGAASGLGYNALEDERYRDRNIDRVFNFRASHPGAENAFFFADLASADVDTVVDLIKRYATKHGVKLFFVDYWQLITGKKSFESKADFLERVAYAFYAVSKLLGVTIVLASQLNRNGESLGSDGGKRACNWAGALHGVDLGMDEHGMHKRGIYIEVEHSRYAAAGPVGGPEKGDEAFHIVAGPAIVEANPALRQDSPWEGQSHYVPPAGAPITEPPAHFHRSPPRDYDLRTGEVY